MDTLSCILGSQTLLHNNFEFLNLVYRSRSTDKENFRAERFVLIGSRGTNLWIEVEVGSCALSHKSIDWSIQGSNVESGTNC